MAKSEMFGPEEISIIQTRQVRKSIHYAYQRSPFYRDMMDRARINPSDIKSLEDLHYLPTTSGEDLLRESERFLCIRPEEVAEIMFTPMANTGLLQREKAGADHLDWKFSDADLARLGYNAQLSFMVASLGARDVVGLALTLDDGAMIGIAAYLGLRRLGATVIRLGHAEPDMLARQLEKAKVTAVVAPPGLLRRTAEWAEAQGRDLGRLNVRRLFCVGQPVRSRDFTLTETGRLLARAWNARVMTVFSNTVSATLVSDCEEECGSHIHPELMHIEILDSQGQPVPDGQVGEVCITPFGVSAMPVIRYRTGDRSFIRSKVCRCDRQTLRLGPILKADDSPA